MFDGKIILLFFAIFLTLPFLGSNVNYVTTDKQPHLVGTFYYVWYSGPDDNPRLFHWNDARCNGVSLRPSLGYYSSRDPDVIQQHIAWLTNAGVDFIIVSWWGINGYEDRATKSLIQTINELDNPIKFCLMVECYPWTCSSPGTFQRLVRYVIDEYTANPAYLRLGGKPVVVAYNAEAELVTSLKDNGLSERLAFFLCGGGSVDLGSDYCSGYIPYSPASSLQSLNYYFNQVGSKLSYRVFMVSPGYDDSHLGRPTSRVVLRNNGSHYQYAWLTALESSPDIIVIVSFNEWHEETSIEPCAEWKDLYLKLTYENTVKFHTQ